MGMDSSESERYGMMLDGLISIESVGVGDVDC